MRWRNRVARQFTGDCAPPSRVTSYGGRDVQNLGEVPDEIPAQASLKSLGYETAAEAIAEKFHTDVNFLTELNPGN